VVYYASGSSRSLVAHEDYGDYIVAGGCFADAGADDVCDYVDAADDDAGNLICSSIAYPHLCSYFENSVDVDDDDDGVDFGDCCIHPRDVYYCYYTVGLRRPEDHLLQSQYYFHFYDPHLQPYHLVNDYHC
jgi:hypothetical protein